MDKIELGTAAGEAENIGRLAELFHIRSTDATQCVIS